MLGSAFKTGSDAFQVSGENHSSDDKEKERSAWTLSDLSGTHQSIDKDGRLGENSIHFRLSELGDLGWPIVEFRNDLPHPKLGGGLFCLLTMPYQIGNVSTRDQAANYLNGNVHTAPTSTPDLLGAWCAGRNDQELCYSAFLPNSLYGVRNLIPAVMLNLETWATIAHHDLMMDND